MTRWWGSFEAGLLQIMSSTIISCVVDHKPQFRLQAWNWIVSLNAAGALRHVHPVIHYVGAIPIQFATAMNTMGATIVEIDPFGSSGSVYCNKLQQLAPLAEHDSDYLILCDADLLFLADPANLVIPGSTRAKIVDMPNPPPELLGALLRDAGFPDEELDDAPDFKSTSKTHRFNCNGGLYIFPKAHLVEICGAWHKWARFCLNRASLLGRFCLHADQLSFMLAMIEIELPFDPLPAAANFPTHFPAEVYAPFDGCDIQTLHYHHRMDCNGLLPTGASEIDKFIGQANEILTAWNRPKSLRLDFQAHE